MSYRGKRKLTRDEKACILGTVTLKQFTKTLVLKNYLIDTEKQKTNMTIKRG